MERYILRMKINKMTEHRGVWMPILYHQLVEDTITVQGWVRRPHEPWSWHVWCENARGEKLDPIAELMELTEGLEYTSDKPEGEPLWEQESVDMWKLYEDKGLQGFWKAQTQPVKNFKSKIFSVVRKNKI